ncbi:MAG: hypothetical protein H6R05_216 [Burkholderiaceae bacterium]|nr:hypothetical protein [Burkholderiaceae bacterium]
MKTEPHLTTALARAAEDVTQTQIEAMTTPAVARTLKHRRTFCYEVYEREDGLWDIEAQMQDRKTYPFTLASCERETAEALHNMILRVTVDNSLNIVDVHTETRAAPYLEQCQQITPDYKKMIGLNIMHGFRTAMRDLFSEENGCTHITELANSLPTVVIQGVGVELAIRHRKAVGDENAGRPFQINQCHALAEGAEAVRLYYPRWYKNPAQS